ncbi:MAG TPA: chloride channel protein, partial [Acidobacteriota bacterium]|nr:chloride channel protein [Acidobacteriota bacterium]
MDDSGSSAVKDRTHLARFWHDPNTQYLLLMVLVGALGALSAIAFRAATRELVILLMRNDDVVTGAGALPAWMRLLIPAAGGFLGGVVARYFVRTGGTMGIAQIMEVVAVGRKRVKFRQSLARTISSLLVISTGGSEGREGPIIQMSAAFASLVARTTKFSSDRTRVLVACGMAAGVAGAYNTPISATLFVVELIMGSFSMAVFGPAIISAFISALLTRSILGDQPLYHVPGFQITAVREVLLCAPLGVLCGFASVLFMKSLRTGKKLFHRLGWKDEWRMALGGLGVGVIGLWFPQVWGNGFEGTNHMLNMAQPVLWMFAAVFLLKILATTLTIGSGGVGGVFTPALMTGAMLGGSFALGLNLLTHWQIPMSGYALLGMGGLLAGTTRAPFLAIIMMAELTQNESILLPMMIVSMLSILGAKVFEKDSVYVEELRESGVRWQEGPELVALMNLKVEDIVRKDIGLVPATLRIPELIKVFLQTRAQCVFVGDSESRLLGVIDLHDFKDVMADPLLRDSQDASFINAGDLVREIPFVTPDESLSSATEKLWVRDLGWLPVVDSASSRKFLGIITRRDLLGAFDREALQNSRLFARVRHDDATARAM